jgi:hypothetical protein
LLTAVVPLDIAASNNARTEYDFDGGAVTVAWRGGLFSMVFISVEEAQRLTG